jgi:large subunit ribosomal protein L4
MQVDVYAMDGQKSMMINVSENIFDKAFNESLIHQVVTACLSNWRQGTHQQKTRAEVSGGGIKPWRQKGTGRARAGTIRSPLWRHGGKTFAARPGVYTQKINKKMYRGAILSIFSKLLKDNRLIIVEKLTVEPKTKYLLKVLADLKAKKSLIIVNAIEPNIALAVRNLVDVELVTLNAINPVNLISHENIVITKEALEKLEEVLNHD